MSIVDALKKLVVAFGGADKPEAVPGSNVAEVIEELAKNPPSGSGGNAPLILHIDENPDSMRLDKTYQEIEDAFLSGRSIFLYNPDGEELDSYQYDFLNAFGLYFDADSNDYLYFVGFNDAGPWYAQTKDDYPTTGGQK